MKDMNCVSTQESARDYSTQARGKESIEASSPPPGSVEPTPEDLMLQFEVRIWGRDREVFSQKRVVSIWKAALPEATYRSLAAEDILGQLKHLLLTVQIQLRKGGKN